MTGSRRILNLQLVRRKLRKIATDNKSSALLLDNACWACLEPKEHSWRCCCGGFQAFKPSRPSSCCAFGLLNTTRADTALPEDRWNQSYLAGAEAEAAGQYRDLKDHCIVAIVVVQ